MSYPARGMWIEMIIISNDGDFDLSYPARGMWIEIHFRSRRLSLVVRRTPRGVCGLKCPGNSRHTSLAWSYPARGMWIEILQWT